MSYAAAAASGPKQAPDDVSENGSWIIIFSTLVALRAHVLIQSLFRREFDLLITGWLRAPALTNSSLQARPSSASGRAFRVREHRGPDRRGYSARVAGGFVLFGTGCEDNDPSRTT